MPLKACRPVCRWFKPRAQTLIFSLESSKLTHRNYAFSRWSFHLLQRPITREQVEVSNPQAAIFLYTHPDRLLKVFHQRKASPSMSTISEVFLPSVGRKFQAGASDRWVECDSFRSRVALLCRRSWSAPYGAIARRRWFLAAPLVLTLRSDRIRTWGVGGNPSALVLPSVEHFLLQTLSSDWVRHHFVLLFLTIVYSEPVVRQALRRQ